jgi:hypothetical protein
MAVVAEGPVGTSMPAMVVTAKMAVAEVVVELPTTATKLGMVAMVVTVL